MNVEELQEKVFIETLQISQDIAEKINSILDFNILLETILELAVEHTGAEKAFIMLSDKGSADFTIRATKNIDNDFDNLNNLNAFFTDKIIPYLKSYNTISLEATTVNSATGIKTVLATKLKFRDELLGYACFFNKTAGENFNIQDKHIIEVISAHSGIAIYSVKLNEKIEYEKSFINNLQRYLPKNTVLKLMDSKVDLSMEGELQNCSVLFSDICGFTTLSEKLQPEQVVSFLNEYLTVMSKVIFSYNGSIDKFIGDGIMAVFGAPVSTPNHAMEAALAALEMRKQIPVLREKFAKEFGIIDFSTRIGINTGPVIYGNVGSPQRLDFTVIGDTVNTAARMESNAPRGGILVSHTTYENIKKLIKVRPLGGITVKGKRDPVRVYEIIDKASAQEPMNLKMTVADKTREALQSKKVIVKSFVVINKEGDITNGLIREIGFKTASIGVIGNYRQAQKIVLSFKLTKDIMFKNIKAEIKKVEKTKQEVINNKAHYLLDVEFMDLSKQELMELARFVKTR